jgi:hypothetical protein
MQLNIPATEKQKLQKKVDAKLKLTPEELREYARTGDIRHILETLLLYVYK